MTSTLCVRPGAARMHKPTDDLDESTTCHARVTAVYLRHGFPGERLHVLPGPLVKEALTRPPTSHLLVTDAGYFPHASRHGRVRRTGSAQAILIMCADGAGWCELEGVRHDVQPGRLLLIPPRAPHSYYADATRPWSIWWLHVAGSDLPALLTAIGLTATQPTATMVDPGPDVRPRRVHLRRSRRGRDVDNPDRGGRWSVELAGSAGGRARPA